MQSQKQYGRLELFIGPMFACKSTELIKTANRYKSIGKSILAVNHVINNRYNSNKITTHDKEILDDCVIVEYLNDIFDKYKDEFNKCDIIIIEELQFFKDAFDFITNVVDNHGKIVVAAGLSGNSERCPFGDVQRLICHAEKVVQLSAFCKICKDGTHGHFTKRVTEQQGEVLVGSEELFIPVCRKHYLE